MRHLRLILPICLIAMQARAQGTELRPGAKIRVIAPGIVAGRLEGTLLSRTRDSLTIGDPDKAPLSIPLAEITSVEISHGKSRAQGALNGVKWGAAIGAGFGLASMNSIKTCTGSPYSTPPNRVCGLSPTYADKQEFVGVMALGGIFYGSIIGAIAGSETWDRFELGTRPTIGMQSGRPALGMSVRF